MRALVLILLAACSSTTAIGTSQSGGPIDAGYPGVPVDAADVDASTAIIPVGTWQTTTALGSVPVAADNNVAVHAGSLYWLGYAELTWQIVSVPTTGGAPVTVATPTGPSNSLTADDLGFAYVGVDGAIGVVPWTGAPTTIRSSGLTYTAVGLRGASVVATGLAVDGSSQVQMIARTGGTPRTLLASWNPQCKIWGSESDDRVVVDDANVYFESIYGAIEPNGQSTPGCRVEPPTGSNWYFGAIPLAGGASFVTAFDAEDLVSTSDGQLFGIAPYLLGPYVARSAIASGTTTPFFTSSPMGSWVTVNDVVVRDGYVYWSEFQGASGLISEVMCEPITGGTAQVVASGPGMTTALAVDATNLYFQVCPGGMGQCATTTLRSAPRCQ